MGWTFSPINNQQCLFHYQGQPTVVDAGGNNVAWICPNCVQQPISKPPKGQPILFVYGPIGPRGAGPNNPVLCTLCGSSYYLDPPYATLGPSPNNATHPANPMTIV